MKWPAKQMCCIAGAVVLVVLAAGVCRGEVTLVRDGEAVGRIYAGELAEKEFVADLVYHIEKMSGAKMEVVAEVGAGKPTTPGIVLGEQVFELSPIKRTPNSREWFCVNTQDDLVLIGGSSEAAVSHGVYELLRRLGCDWVMPGEIGEIIPQRKTVAVPAMNISQQPAFETRRLWYRGYPPPRLPEENARFDQWLRRHKGNSMGSHPLLACSGHAWGAFIGKHKAEFDADPTMFALVRMPDGSMQRRGPQLESTHPRVIELFVEDIKAQYARNIEAGTWTKDTVAGFGIGPSDGLGYSMSPESLAAGSGRIDPIVGEVDRTDELILMGNRILEQVHKDYPNAHVGFYSYSVHADYPKRHKPNPKLVQIFAPINFSRFHSVLDANSKSQAYCRDVVEQWGRLSREQGNPLFFRGYNWNLADNMLPYSKARIWGEELPFYKGHGIIGLNVEATKAWSVNGPSDYVFMRLAWDTRLEWPEVLREYCERSFGAAAEPMRDYLLWIADTQRDAGEEAGSYLAFHRIYGGADLKTAGQTLQRALADATDPAQKTRIGHFVHGFEALKIYLDYHAATLRHDIPAAKRLYDAMLAHWQKAYDQNTDLVASEVPQYLKRFVGPFIDGAANYSSEPYRIIDRIPDELATMFDPNEIGHRMNYHRPEINDTAFIRTRTISSTWDAQGLAGIRSGAVWYRHHLKLPADANGEPVGLFIGGVEDEARVWINGEAVGTSGVGFSLPFVFDLTDGIRYDADNLLAMQVIRNSKANEIGLGGILRPSFIFTGPRLEQKAPKPMDLGRVLPGGEVE